MRLNMYLYNIMQTFKSIWGGKNALKDTHQNIKK